MEYYMLAIKNNPFYEKVNKENIYDPEYEIKDKSSEMFGNLLATSIYGCGPDEKGMFTRALFNKKDHILFLKTSFTEKKPIEWAEFYLNDDILENFTEDLQLLIMKNNYTLLFTKAISKVI